MPVGIVDSPERYVTYVPPPPDVPSIQGLMPVVYQPNTPFNVVTPLADAQSVSFHRPLSMKGSASFVLDSASQSLIDYPTVLNVWNMVRMFIAAEEQWWGFITDVSPQEMKDEPDLYQVTCTGGLVFLKRAMVYPYDYPTNFAPIWIYSNATPGKILGDQISDAQGRGGLVGLTKTFSDTLDSNGEAWSILLTVEIKPGTNLLSLVEEWVTLGLDVELSSDLELSLYNQKGANAP